MYNYIGLIRKSTSVSHCLRANFFNPKIPNLILSKNNIIEFYDLTKEGLKPNTSINIYGKIILMLSIPSHDPENKSKDNLFVLSEDLDFALFSFNKKLDNNIDDLITGSIEEDLGKKQDNILYSLDTFKNYLLISAYQNIFKLICVNNEMRINEKKRDFTIKYPYENILFLSPFAVNYYLNSKPQNKNILTFAAIKKDRIDNDTNNNINNNNENNHSNYEEKYEIALETFQIKIESNLYTFIPYQLKNSDYLKNQINSTSSNINNKNTNNIITNDDNINFFQNDDENYLNLLQKIDITDDPTVSLMITHPNGIIFLFFSHYVIYFKYDNKSKNLISQDKKKIKYQDRKFVAYTIIDEKTYRYCIIDEKGYLFLLAIIYNNSNENFLVQYLGEINYSTCLTYLDNNYFFIGSNKGNSQLVKIEQRNKSFVNVIENYEALSPINNFIVVNNNLEQENNIEIYTISGIEKNCCIKMIKKGAPALIESELEIKNIKNVFKIIINENNSDRIETDEIQNYVVYSLVINTINKSLIIDYNTQNKTLSLNKKINFEKNEKVLFAQNIKNNKLIFVTNLKISIYKNEITGLTSIINKELFNDKFKPLIIKYNEKLHSLFVYTNNNKLISYTIDENGNISEIKELIKDVNISSFGLCQYFLIYSLLDSNKLGIYSINTNKTNFLNEIDESLDYVNVTSIEIMKIEGIRYVIIALSNGRLLYFKLKEQFRNYKYYEFSENDFIFKRKYNLNDESFEIVKMKHNNKKFLFINTITPSLIYFNNETPVLSNLNIKNCKNLFELNENKYLFIFNHKIAFGSLSNSQSQNIFSKLYGKQLYNIDLISFGNNNNNLEQNKIANYILTIEEEKKNNIIKSSLVLSDLLLKEISRFNFGYDNEISTSFTELNLSINNSFENKLIVIGTGICENISEEPILGHLYLIEIDSLNNYSMKKVNEIETKGGVYKVKACKNILYVGIGNTLYIYQINKIYDNNSNKNVIITNNKNENKNNNYSYEFKLLKKIDEFTLINNIYIFDYKKINKIIQEIKRKKSKISKNKENENMDIDSDEFSEENKTKINQEIKNNESINNIQYLIIVDLYRSVTLYSFDILNDKFTEISRDYSLTWVFGISQCKSDSLYITDIDGNIITLYKELNPKNDQEKFKLERTAFFNFGERINCLVSTSIKNDKLYEISNENNNIDLNDNEVKITFFGTIEGSLGIIIQLNKEIYDFLRKLQDLIIKNKVNNGNFSYKKWRSYKNERMIKESQGFVEGDILDDFLNFEEQYKKSLINELNYPWKKTFNEVIKIIETLAKLH